ncbi:hypothetical protein LOCC1_G007439 [Lachnellula occidentalis]|uniref:Uncharacterized protein n=1 Tax=Lachnellula occidentalis TaxID=215460 RepID=A0A8H8U6Z6_9HELO|nr:hypothetical protein LOCC1_G007439 [Lachnellula occidentalis]
MTLEKKRLSWTRHPGNLIAVLSGSESSVPSAFTWLSYIRGRRPCNKAVNYFTTLILINTAPANEALRWQLHQFHSGDGHEGTYSGYPRPEHEEAWKGLLHREYAISEALFQKLKLMPLPLPIDMNVRLSREDLKAINHEEDAV